MSSSHQFYERHNIMLQPVSEHACASFHHSDPAVLVTAINAIDRATVEQWASTTHRLLKGSITSASDYHLALHDATGLAMIATLTPTLRAGIETIAQNMEYVHGRVAVVVARKVILQLLKNSIDIVTSRRMPHVCTGVFFEHDAAWQWLHDAHH